MKVAILEKLESGELRLVDEREWEAAMVTSLDHSNYLLVQGKEFQMVEGRLNIDKARLEVLVIAVNSDTEPLQ